MSLPRTKEREYRFKLALKIGLPVFALFIALISNTLIVNYHNLSASFYFQIVLFLFFSIYFIFFVIYKGFDIKITENVSKTFTRDYLYFYLKKDIKKEKQYTLILISVDNLSDINTTYGIKNGDKVLFEVTQWICKYFKSKNIVNFPIGHIKAGDFVLGLKGSKSEYKSILDLMSIKSSDFKVDDIEVEISSAITDTSFSNTFDYMIENLFEIQEENKNKEFNKNIIDMNQSELESAVFNAINKKDLSVMTQNVFEGEKVICKDCFIKLKTADNKLIYPKSYIKVIQKLGLSIEFDMLILEYIVLSYKSKDNEILSLNISPTSIRNQKFISFVKDTMINHKYIKNKIMFVISEHEYYSHIQKYKFTINTLRNLGVLIALDKIGSLHSSFLYLRDLDVDVIRFDSYYSKHLKNLQNHNIIDGFNIMAHEKANLEIRN